MNDKIHELLISKDGVNNILGVQLAFGQYGKSVETFIEIIKASVNEIEVGSEISDLTNILICDSFCLNIWTDGHLNFYIIDTKFIYTNESIINWDNVFDQIGDFINISDLDFEDYDVYISLSNTNLDFNNIQIDTFLRRLYHFLTYFDLL